MEICQRTTRDQFPTPVEISAYLGKIFPNEGIAKRLFHDRWGFSGSPCDAKRPVKKIFMATTPSMDMVSLLCSQYDLLINHHDFDIPFPQITYHVAMDAAMNYGQNYYFAKRMGLTDIRQLGGLSVIGNLPVKMSLKALIKLLVKRGFDIDGQVWSRNTSIDNVVRSVVYCSGLGGMCLTCWEGEDLNLSRINADVFVTGELTLDAGGTSHKFKHIIELGHTNSEKPIFTWIKHYLKNRWINLEIDIADNDIDRWGQETYS